MLRNSLIMAGGAVAVVTFTCTLAGYSLSRLQFPGKRALMLSILLCRLVQSFSTGGEYSGANIFVIEHAPPGKRGWFGSFAPMGVTVGNLLAAGVFYLVTMLSRDQMLAWGWRIPFLISAILLLNTFGAAQQRLADRVHRDVVARRGRPGQAT